MVINLNPYAAIFLDLAGTLIQVKGSVAQVYRRVALDWGVVLDEQVLERRFSHVFEQTPRLTYGATAWEQAERDWWRRLVWQVVEGGQFRDFEGYFSYLYAYFAQGAAWELYPEVIETLEQIQIPIVLVSNFDGRVVQILRELDLTPYFQHMVYSSQVGCAKPNRAIFDHALGLICVPPERVLHVGDSWREDVLGAQQAGLQALWLNRGVASARTPQIQNLAQLVSDPVGLKGG